MNLWLLEHREVSGIFNCGTGRAQTFNDVAAAVVNTVQRRRSAHAAASWSPSGCIEYIPFPPALVGKYQSYTRRTCRGCARPATTASSQTVEEGVAAYVRRCSEDVNKTLEDFIGNTPLVRLQRLPGAEQHRQRHPRQARGQQPGRLGEGPAGDVDDPATPRSAAASSRATR